MTMQVMDIPREGPIEQSAVKLMAYMFHPKDENARRIFVDSINNDIVSELVAEHRYKKLSENGMSMVTDALVGPRKIDHARQYASSVITGYTKETPGWSRPQMSGFILAITLSRAERNLNSASLEASYGIIADMLTASRLKGGSRGNLLSIWNDYAPVAHYWAAMIAAGRAWNEGTLGGFQIFVSFAEEMRRRAILHQHPQSSDRLVSADMAWQFPEWMPLHQMEGKLPEPQYFIGLLTESLSR